MNMSLDDVLELASSAGYTVEIMDEDELSVPDSPIEESGSSSREQSAFDRQKASLQSYLDAMPYKCESLEAMQEKLEAIVSKICLCAETKNWLVLTTWDGILQCWLLMRYPIHKTTRAKLARLYYELCLVPGIEPRVIRSWADMLSRLLNNKGEQKRKLDTEDLELPWQPLWYALKKELWPKKRLQDTTRNVVNILLFIAESCRRYFPANEIPSMLSELLPILTKESILSMVPVLVSFLPPSHVDLYLPTLFQLWRAFNSQLIDDRLLELCGEISEEQVSGTAGEVGSSKWRSIGIWTDMQWSFLMTKTLNSMNVPIGAQRGINTTAGHADSQGDKQSLRIKKPINRYNALAKILVYSLSHDGPDRGDPSISETDKAIQPGGYLAGSKALDSLDKLITSTETYFHPSNSGHWSLTLNLFVQRLTAEFIKRWNEEKLPTCKTPVTQRLTPLIRRAFVTILRTPCLLAMFSKDPFSMTYAQASLRALAHIEPNLIMPELLDRAYGGLEVVNETHRTTAVLTTLAGVALPLTSENIWLGGQKHIVPLLELCIPGIDLNDPAKTLCTAMFITSVVQHIRIGDMTASGVSFSSDAPFETLAADEMQIDQLPDGTEPGGGTLLSREEERTLTRESTAGFADWVVSLFRRVLALYENLPEEGGRRNTTGGKMEEGVLKAIKNTLDIVCLHLSDQLFDLVLKLVYDYATTNAKSNAVRAFGQLVACLARVNPEKTIDKFLPFCIAQIQEELKHGASSIRTTSTHTAVPSDTTLHWNISILRGCFSFAGAVVLKYRQQLLDLMTLLVDKLKSERGYSGAGRLMNRVLHTLCSVYVINTPFVNTDEWRDPDFVRNNSKHWGRLYEPQDVKIDWHVPTEGEVEFALEVLDLIASPLLDKIEILLESAARWDNVARNDFCRYLHAVRCIWSGLPVLLKEINKELGDPCVDEEIENSALLITSLDVEAGFVLTDPDDPRYQKALAHRTRFGDVVHRAAIALRQGDEAEDHIDAVIGVSKAIDVFLLEYGMTRGSFDAYRKIYVQARDANRIWSRQKENTRMVFLKRAHVYHAGRVYMHALYRRRSPLDDSLLQDLVEMSLSPYTRVRRQAQAILTNACGYFVRSNRVILPHVFSALATATDPDRMKGALYILWNKGTAAYALADVHYHSKYLLSILNCQHQEKPSIQKLVGNVAQDSYIHLTEEAIHTHAYRGDIPQVLEAVKELRKDCTQVAQDDNLLAQCLQQNISRAERKEQTYNDTVTAILEISTRSATHWRYVQIAMKFLYGLLRRDVAPSGELARMFLQHSISPHSTIRTVAQRAIIRLCCHIKMRSFAKSDEELWKDAWSNPLQTWVQVDNPDELLERLQRPMSRQGEERDVYIDKIETGFITWTPRLKAYRTVPPGESPLSWEQPSRPALEAMGGILLQGNYFTELALLWGQESSKGTTHPEMRLDNAAYIKTLAKMFEHKVLDSLLQVIDPLILDSDRFKQRCGAEMLAGLLRGKFQALATTVIKPDTAVFWEGFVSEQLVDRDPRRAQPLVDWMLSLPLDFHGDSAFAMSKSLSMLNIAIDCLGLRFLSRCDKYADLFFENTHTGYAEVRQQIAQNIYALMSVQWRPTYASVDSLLKACKEEADPLHIRNTQYLDRIVRIKDELIKQADHRLPPPRSSQSLYDKIGLTLLQWIWNFCHGYNATLVWQYIIVLLPVIFRMSELQDHAELVRYSSAVLYICSAIAPPEEDLEHITELLIDATSSDSWRIRSNALPVLITFFFRNFMGMKHRMISRVVDVLLECLVDENVEVRETAALTLSTLVRCSERQRIIPLKNRFIGLAQKTRLPDRRDPKYSEALRTLHSAILGLCALIQSFPYSVEPWLPPLTDVLAFHATDPLPISTTIRKCASEFKKTHQDTWHKDQLLFDEEQLQNLSTMLVGTSYYA